MIYKKCRRVARRRIYRALLLGVIALLLDAAAGSALAADASIASADKPVLEEIVVTAEKRKENLQNVPLSVTSLSGERLKSTGTENTGDLQNVVPNLEILAGSANTQFAIRGVDPLAPLPANDPVVGFQIDGVPEARPAGANGVFYDIERIEVLRGPQGTLYGRNTTAGVINVITNKPTDTFAVSSEVGFGDYNRFHTGGLVNVPLSSELSVRAAFQTDRHNPYISTGLPTGNADADDRAGRVHLLYTPTQDISLLLSGDYYKRQGAGNNELDLTNIRNQSDPWSYTYPTTSRGVFIPNVDATNSGFSAELNWALPLVQLTNIIGRRFVNDDESNFTGGRIGTLQSDSQEFTEEFRVSSLPGTRLNWVAGAFYSAEHERSAVVKIDSFGPGSETDTNNDSIVTKSIAVFGNTTFNLSNTLRLISGLRYTKDRKDGNGEVSLLTPTNPISTLPFNARLRSSNVDWRLGVQKDVAEKSMVYFTASRSYKAGGYYEVPPGTLNQLPNTFQPEYNLAFELGSKNRFMDDRLQINGDVFFYHYTDFQTQAPGRVFLPGGASSTILATLNAGTVGIFGTEVELDYQLTPHDRIGLDIDYLHARFGNFSVPGFIVGNVAVFGTTSLNGLPVPDTPTWAGNLAVTHTWDLSSAMILTAHANTHYRGATNFQVPADPLAQQPAYWSTNAGFSVQEPSRRWYLDLLVKNISNAVVITNVSVPPSGHIGPPRTFEVNIGGRY